MTEHSQQLAEKLIDMSNDHHAAGRSDILAEAASTIQYLTEALDIVLTWAEEHGGVEWPDYDDIVNQVRTAPIDSIANKVRRVLDQEADTFFVCEQCTAEEVGELIKQLILRAKDTAEHAPFMLAEQWTDTHYGQAASALQALSARVGELETELANANGRESWWVIESAHEKAAYAGEVLARQKAERDRDEAERWVISWRDHYTAAEASTSLAVGALENLIREANRIGPQLPYNAPTQDLSEAIDHARETLLKLKEQIHGD